MILADDKGLTERQSTILGVVAQGHIEKSAPVSSRAVASRSGLGVSASTVRNEFAVLEEKGYLTHPHTSAGRVPTDQGYRRFVDGILQQRSAGKVPSFPLKPEALATEVDSALQQTSEVMSQATNLLALVVGPRLSGARLRHVELLQLQPNLVTVVFIASTGHVTKQVMESPVPVDPGTLDWARTYVNEMTEDRLITERLVRSVAENSELGETEKRFMDLLAPAFERLVDEQAAEALYVGGTSRLWSDSQLGDVADVGELLGLLEERYMMLRLLRSVLGGEGLAVIIGEEHRETALRGFSVVAASYGVPQRSLGTVSLLGPVRMDYENAIGTVRATSRLLSLFLEARYE